MKLQPFAAGSRHVSHQMNLNSYSSSLSRVKQESFLETYIFEKKSM